MSYPTYEKIESQIAESIKELRIAAGYTSYENFAIEHELDRKQYWKMEKGQNITIKSLHKVLKIHNKTFSDFFKKIN